MTSFVSNPVLGHPSLNFIKRNNLSTITAVAAVAVGVTGVSVIYGLTQEVFGRGQWREHLFYQSDFNARETGRIIKQHVKDVENISLPVALNNSLPRPLTLEGTKDLNFPSIIREQRLIAYNAAFLDTFMGHALKYTQEFAHRTVDLQEKLAYDTQLLAFEDFINKVIHAKSSYNDNLKAVTLLKASAKKTNDEEARQSFRKSFEKPVKVETTEIYDSPLKWIPYYGIYSAFTKK